MVYCKKLLILFFCLIFVCGFCYASEMENVEFTTISGINVNPNGNYFTSASGNVMYVTLEKGYIYHINVSDSVPSQRYVAVCDNIPALNVVYDLIGTVQPGNVYDYIPTTDGYFLVASPGNTVNISFTREKLDNQDSAINGLVENVGPNAFWGVFGSGLDFVFIIVIVAFGLFIIYKLIKGLSKGKSKI